MRSHALFALGMHRSGTSAITGVLSCLGVVLGKRLYAAQKGVNERGFWEHADIVDTHDSVLRTIGSYWDDILPIDIDRFADPRLARFKRKLTRYVRRDFSNTQMWGLKDPRTCRLLPLWLDILGEFDVDPKFLFIVRAPWEVSRSLQKRDGFSQEKSLVLWLRHNLEAEFWSRGHLRTFVTFDDLMSNTDETLRLVESSLKIRFPVDIERASDEIHEFLDADLRHFTYDDAPSHDVLNALARDTYLHLSSGETDSEAFRRVADTLRERLKEATSRYDPLLLEQLRYIGRERGKYEQMFLEIYQSTTWKVSWPIRVIERLLRGGSPGSL